ncbi:hypothetical protein DFP72DRAFT_174698 [Ephemerocybe angulata]|uniref:Uncharacterized protein n=1 Tax=Ephemerocybe angulata TaxID=980116 RepID=A0A8H6M887_9AGAR|nr:hypothetical protein DFP72DRAFT_174698 [Tulosesus angulatus]
MPNPPPEMDHVQKAYFAVTYAPSSTFITAPASLSSLKPSISYVGQVGELSDVHLYSAPKNDGDQVAAFLKERRGGSEGIVDVEVQIPQTRVKRGGDEL